MMQAQPGSSPARSATDPAELADPLADQLAESVREWVAAWGREVAAVDLAAGRRRFDDDVVAFGTYAHVVTGADRVLEQQWANVWPTIEDFAFVLDELHVQASGDGLMAVAIVPWTSTGIGADGERFDRPGRATIVLRRDRIDAPWRGTHTHFSLGRDVPPQSHGRRAPLSAP